MYLIIILRQLNFCFIPLSTQNELYLIQYFVSTSNITLILIQLNFLDHTKYLKLLYQVF